MKLAFVGDIMLGRGVNEALNQRSAPWLVWGDTVPILRGAEARICNLECVISNKGEPFTPKAFYFRSDIKNIEVLGAVGISGVSIANNHVLDFGGEALAQMTGLLTKTGIKFAGAGKNFEEARKPAVWTAGDKKIGLLAFTDNEPGWEADEGKTGTYFVPTDLADKRTKELISLVKETKTKVDILVVSAHWGGNWGYTAPEEHKKLGRELIDAGADIIFGHSAHVFRGVEVYKREVIIYSAGDFIDDYAIDEIERNDQAFIFVVETGEKGIEKIFLYPTVIADFSARMAKGAERDATWKKMASLCADLGTVTKWNEMRGRLEISI